jgi:hypothetical protein
MLLIGSSREHQPLLQPHGRRSDFDVRNDSAHIPSAQIGLLISMEICSLVLLLPSGILFPDISAFAQSRGGSLAMPIMERQSGCWGNLDSTTRILQPDASFISFRGGIPYPGSSCRPLSPEESPCPQSQLFQGAKHTVGLHTPQKSLFMTLPRKLPAMEVHRNIAPSKIFPRGNDLDKFFLAIVDLRHQQLVRVGMLFDIYDFSPPQPFRFLLRSVSRSPDLSRT